MQRSGACPIFGNIQDKIGWGFEHPDWVEGVCAHCGGVTLDVLWKSFPTQTTLFEKKTPKKQLTNKENKTKQTLNIINWNWI